MRLTVVLLYCAKLSAVCKPHVDLIGYGGLKKRENFLQQAAVYGVVGRFTGGNGSGKSTLAKHMNAILLPSGGKVYVDGMDTADEASRKKYQVLRVKFSFIKFLLPAKRRRLPLNLRFFKYYITISGGLCYNKENLT